MDASWASDPSIAGFNMAEFDSILDDDLTCSSPHSSSPLSPDSGSDEVTPNPKKRKHDQMADISVTPFSWQPIACANTPLFDFNGSHIEQLIQVCTHTLFVQTETALGVQPVEVRGFEVHLTSIGNNRQVRLLMKNGSHKGDAIPQSIAVGGFASHKKLFFEKATANNGQWKRHADECPEQEFFHLVARVFAVDVQDSPHEVFAFISSPIIVRGSNPGNYQADSSKGGKQWTTKGGTVSTTQNVGIGVTESQEALSVAGNIQMTGTLLKPSDRRIKSNITAVDTDESMERVRSLKVYDYEREDLVHGDKHQERGVIAQELAEVIPEAVHTQGDVVLADGRLVEDLNVVDERMILMDTVAAVQNVDERTQEQQKREDVLESHVVEMGVEMGSIRGRVSRIEDHLPTSLGAGSPRRCTPTVCVLSAILMAVVLGVAFLTVFHPPPPPGRDRPHHSGPPGPQDSREPEPSVLARDGETVYDSASCVTGDAVEGGQIDTHYCARLYEVDEVFTTRFRCESAESDANFPCEYVWDYHTCAVDTDGKSYCKRLYPVEVTVVRSSPSIYLGERADISGIFQVVLQTDTCHSMKELGLHSTPPIYYYCQVLLPRS